MIPPFVIHRPAGDARLLYDSPHSGRYYPPDFVLGSPLAEMRRGEDAYVDELLLPSVEGGAVLLVNNFPRCYIDVNRADTDIEPSQLAEPWPGDLHPTEKSRRGLGLIRKFVVPGVTAQHGALSVADVQKRIDAVYRPYCDALAELVFALRNAHGAVLHINWHSMKSKGNAMTPDGAGAVRADFVVSDVRGTSAAPAVTAHVVELLRGMRYTVTVNEPYTGGAIVQRTGAPALGVHSIQIEINRALYLDETRVEKSDGFAALANNLQMLTRQLSELSLSLRGPNAQAAR